MSLGELEFSMKLSDNLIQLFQNKKYEKYVYLIMKKSQHVFPEDYSYVSEQAHGECDYIGIDTGKKYDAKLPFTEEQVIMLVDDKKHKRKLTEWLINLLNESSEFNIEEIQNGTYNITKTQLYSIIKKHIERSKKDENIIFFFPFPVAISIRGSIYLNFVTDFLSAIYGTIKNEIKLNEMEIFAIYPSAEKNIFAVRELKHNELEFVECNELEKFFSYELVNVH